MPKTKSTPTPKKQPETSKKRKSLTAAQKKEVCLKKLASPFLKNKDLAKEYVVSEGMISDTLRAKERWLAVDLNSHQAGLKREKKVPFPLIEEALTIWVESALQTGLVLTDDILSTKALEFAFLLKEDKFKGSNGWVDGFKKRHNLKQYNIHGEAASAPLENLSTMREDLRQTLKDYNPEDIFNCDETGLFWKMKPSRTISNGPVSGTKQSKDRVTVLLTCNAIGNEKLPPLFIHKYENPRALKNINKKTLPVDYYWNQKSWMQVSIWNEYIKKLNNRMRRQNRNILLLVDNAPTHALYETTYLTNITIKYLPPNTTSHLQPCDQGIINSFKSQYRKLYLRNRVKAFDKFREFGIEPVEININKCIKYVAHAWDNVTSATIEHCWTKADILPNKDDEDYEDHNANAEPDIELEIQRLKELEEVQVLIDKLGFEDPLTADEFVQYDKSEIAREMISDEEIIKAVHPEEKEVETVETPLPQITHDDVIESYDKVILYLEQQESDYDKGKEELKFIKSLKKEALKKRFISARQVSLDSFVTII
jgi:hypothetical protein